MLDTPGTREGCHRSVSEKHLSRALPQLGHDLTSEFLSLGEKISAGAPRVYERLPGSESFPGDERSVGCVGLGRRSAAPIQRQRSAAEARRPRPVHLLHRRRRAAAFFNADDFLHPTVVAVAMTPP